MYQPTQGGAANYKSSLLEGVQSHLYVVVFAAIGGGVLHLEVGERYVDGVTQWHADGPGTVPVVGVRLRESGGLDHSAVPGHDVVAVWGGGGHDVVTVWERMTMMLLHYRKGWS